MNIQEIREKIKSGDYEISVHPEEEMMHKYGDCSFCGGEVKEEIVELDYRY